MSTDGLILRETAEPYGSKAETVKGTVGEDTEGEMPLKLYYDSETADLLERRMILERDICSVITAAEETRERIRDTRSGLYIAHKWWETSRLGVVPAPGGWI